jgi:hypothetical protein
MVLDDEGSGCGLLDRCFVGLNWEAICFVAFTFFSIDKRLDLRFEAGDFAFAWVSAKTLGYASTRAAGTAGGAESALMIELWFEVLLTGEMSSWLVVEIVGDSA